MRRWWCRPPMNGLGDRDGAAPPRPLAARRGRPLDPGRGREHLEAHRRARQRDRNRQRRSCVSAHRSAAVNEQHDSRCTPRPAQPAWKQHLYPRPSAGRPAACVENRIGVHGVPDANGATGRGGAGERTVARRRASPGRCVATLARRTSRPRAGCSSTPPPTPPPWTDRRLSAIGVIGPPPSADASSASAVDG